MEQARSLAISMAIDSIAESALQLRAAEPDEPAEFACDACSAIVQGENLSKEER